MEAILAAQQTPLDRGALARVARSQELDQPAVSSLSGTVLRTRFAALYDEGTTSNTPLHRVTRSRGADMVRVTVPDVRGLSARAAVRRMHELGFRVRWHGSGPVTRSVPEAGSTLALGDTVHLASTRSHDD